MANHGKPRWLRIRRDEVGLVILVPLLASSVFIFFKSFFDTRPDDLTIEILAAMLGSIVTVIITMMLIKRQGSIEQAHQAAATSKTTVFEKKLVLFRDFIRRYVQAASDAVLDLDELAELEEIALTISLFTKDVAVGKREIDLGEELCRFVLQLQIFGLETDLPPDQHELFTKFLSTAHDDGAEPQLMSFVHILRLMKIELGIAQTGSPHDLNLVRHLELEYEWAMKLLNYREHRRNGNNHENESAEPERR